MPGTDEALGKCSLKMLLLLLLGKGVELRRPGMTSEGPRKQALSKSHPLCNISDKHPLIVRTG